MEEREPTERAEEDDDRKRGEKKSGGNWADEAAKARTADDPRARTPRDAVGQPSTRSLDE